MNFWVAVGFPDEICSFFKGLAENQEKTGKPVDVFLPKSNLDFTYERRFIMPFVVTKDMETGNSQIDREHVELFDKINDFMEACNSGKGRGEILNTIQFLQKYTKTHFTNEESLQRIHKYPDFIQHKSFHDKFMLSISNILKQYEKEGVSIALLGKINQEIGYSLIAHIKTEDVKLAKFLQEKQK